LLSLLRKQSWIVWREYGLGEDTGGWNDAGWWARIPSWMIPRPVERLAYRLANPIEDIRKSLAAWFRWAALVFELGEDGNDLARILYWRCAIASAVLSAGTCYLEMNLEKILWTVLGVAVATHRLPGVRQALTARRASHDQAECRERRQAGGCALLAFFTPTPDWRYGKVPSL